MQLVNSVLSAIPIYYMACFSLPEWVIARIDQIRRGFLWGRNGTERAGIPLLNWNTVTLPKCWGGMGIANLRLRNTSLLLRWWWRAYNDPESLWTTVIFKIRLIGANTDGPLIWSQQGSFFWRQLRKIKSLFHCCAKWSIGQGTIISFWYDTWGDRPILISSVGGTRPPFQRISLRDATALIRDIAPQAQMTPPTFNADEDRIFWYFENSGGYSAKSIYAALAGMGKVKWKYNFTWRLKCTPTVKIFLYLMLKSKLLTHEVMMRRNFQCDFRCVLCETCTLETAMHLFFQCHYATQVWLHVERLRGNRILAQGESVENTWDRSCRMYRGREAGHMTEQLVWVAVCWAIWKQRNSRIFEKQTYRPEQIAGWAIQEAELWCRLC